LVLGSGSMQAFGGSRWSFGVLSGYLGILIERHRQVEARASEEVPLDRPRRRLRPPREVYRFSKAVNALSHCVRGKSGVHN